MNQVHPTSTRRKGLWATLAIAAMTGAVTIALPTTLANADPAPPPPSTTTAAPPPASPNAAPDTAPGPGDPNATPPPADPNAPPPPADPNAPPPPADPNAPPPSVDPNAPAAGRIDNPAGGFSYVIPAGWVESDASHLDYGSALLSKETGPAAPGQAPPVANDTRIVMGRLDQKLYASAESDNTKAAVRLASDMGEFFMPYPGTRINQETTALSATGMSGGASYYEVKFTDTAKPNGQIWTGVIGSTAPNAAAPPQRWFVVWLGTGNDPVDKAAAKTLAESIRPFTPPPAPPTPAAPPAPGAPAPAPAPAAPAAPPTPEAPAPAPAPAAPAPAPAPAAPAPAPAPAGEVAPGTAPPPQATVST